MPPSSRSLTLYTYAPSFFSFSHAMKLIDLTESYSWQAEAHPWAWVTPTVRLMSPQPCLHKIANVSSMSLWDDDGCDNAPSDLGSIQSETADAQDGSLVYG